MDIQHEKRLTEVEERSKSNSHRLAKLEERQDNLDELVGTVKVLAVQEKTLENDIREIKVDVKAIADKPAKHWDSVVNTIITAIAAAVIGFILANVGL
jgi:predicted  nucleic acid-binding Zn-ribbon protein